MLQFYPHLLRYLQSHEKDKIGEIFAMIIESCHELVPPEEIKPLIEKIISNFITEQCNNLHITIGLNAVREILMRMPLALDESQIEYLVEFRHIHNASVVAAAKSLINYFRDVCPNLLPKKYRGRFTKQDDRKEDMVYGRQKVNYGVDGIELLEEAEGLKGLGINRVLTNEDLKKIKLLKLKRALKGVVKDNGEKKESSSEGEEDQGESNIDDENSYENDEAGEEELSEYGGLEDMEGEQSDSS
jgi:protein SDA1